MLRSGNKISIVCLHGAELEIGLGTSLSYAESGLVDREGTRKILKIRRFCIRGIRVSPCAFVWLYILICFPFGPT